MAAMHAVEIADGDHGADQRWAGPAGAAVNHEWLGLGACRHCARRCEDRDGASRSSEMVKKSLAGCKENPPDTLATPTINRIFNDFC
jgi:hypothetical protein